MEAETGGHFTIRTHDNVSIEFQSAGWGSRFMAQLLDGFVFAPIGVVLFFGTSALLGLFAPSGDSVDATISSIFQATAATLTVIVAYVLYLALSEGLSAGRTLGKAGVGLRVVRTDGSAIGMSEALLRNLSKVIGIERLGPHEFGALHTLHATTSIPCNDSASPAAWQASWSNASHWHLRHPSVLRARRPLSNALLRPQPDDLRRSHSGRVSGGGYAARSPRIAHTAITLRPSRPGRDQGHPQPRRRLVGDHPQQRHRILGMRDGRLPARHPHRLRAGRKRLDAGHPRRCGVIEGFVSPSTLPPPAKFAIGIVFASLVYAWLLLAGRTQRPRVSMRHR